MAIIEFYDDGNCFKEVYQFVLQLGAFNDPKLEVL